MGIITSKTYDKKITKQINKLEKAKEKIKELEYDNNIINIELTTLKNKLNIIKDNNKKLILMMDRYNKVLNSPKIMSRHILNSEINYGCLNDKDNKKYIIDIINFINVACNDMTSDII